MNNYNLYWGEMHTHTYCGNNRFGEIEDAVETAKTHLDFWAPGEHYNKGSQKHSMFDWKRISNAVTKSNIPGKFVAFLGFEFAKSNGDYNIYFQNDLAAFPEINSYSDLFSFARKENAILIPHHLGYKVGCRGMKWDWFDVSIMPLVEIFSMHGSSEDDNGTLPMNLPWMGPRETAGTAIKGLMLGNVFGFIASSDGHNAYPGAYKMGLAAVYARELTRGSIWNAFRKRHTYAVTGDRIILKFDINGHLMGEVCSGHKKRSISVSVEGLDVIDKIEIIKNGRILVRKSGLLNPRYPRQGKFKIRIEWGWGQPELWKIKGSLKVKGGEVLSAVPCFGPPGPNKILSHNKDVVSWTSCTVGNSIFDWKTGRYAREGTNSIVFEIQGDIKTVLELKLNNCFFSYSFDKLMDNSHVELASDSSGQKVKFHKLVPESQYYKTFQMIDISNKDSGFDFYYVRVIQTNGQMAWSSPIWVNNKR